MAWRVGLFLGAFVALCGGLVLWPGIDLAASRAFWEPGQGFYLATWLPFRAVGEAIPFLVGISILLYLVLGIRELDWRAAAFGLIALAVGPGLVVNVLFKDH